MAFQILVGVGDELVWRVTKNPNGDFFYGPYAVTLTLKLSDVHQGEHQIVMDKAFFVFRTFFESESGSICQQRGVCQINRHFR
jgi:hypothetical protein